MESFTYGVTPGGLPIGGGQGGTPQRSAGIYGVEPRRAEPPGDQPQPDANRPSVPFKGAEAWGSYDPSSSPDDSHNEPFEVGDGPPSTGELPPNVIDGDVGSVAADFDEGGDDGYDASSFGPVPENIIV